MISVLQAMFQVVGCIDKELASYAARIMVQERRKEFIDNLKSAVHQMLDLYFSRHRRLPERIVMYRDGVGESMFLTVRETSGIYGWGVSDLQTCTVFVFAGPDVRTRSDSASVFRYARDVEASQVDDPQGVQAAYNVHRRPEAASYSSFLP